MTSIAEAFVSIRPDTRNFGREAETGIASPMKSVAKTIFAALGGAFAVQKGFQFVKGALDAAAESNKIAAQTQAVLKSTGGTAGVTAEFVGKLSHSLQNLSGVQDENIQSGANMLLTFTNIKNQVGAGNDIFTQATKTLLDMSVATGQDMPSAAVQLGKALNDPIAGLSALTRVGVTFTDAQKEQIKTLVATGDAAGAQKVILAELSKEFGGSAAAAGEAQTPMERLSLKWGDMQEQLGTFLIPKIEALVTIMASAADWFERNRTVMVPLITVVGSLTAAVVAITAASRIYTAVQGALNIVLSANPIGLVVLAIAALAAGVIYAYTHSEKFRAIVDGAFRAIAAAAQFLASTVSGAFDWIKAHLDLVLLAFGPLGLVVIAFRHNWETVWNAVSATVKTTWDVIRPIIRTIKNAIEDIIDLADKVGGIVGKIGGVIGHIPGFAEGVQNFRGGLALVGENGPELVRLPAGSDVLPMRPGGSVTDASVDTSRLESLLEKLLAAMERQTDRQVLLARAG